MNKEIEKLFNKFDNILKNYELDKKIGELSVDSICHLFPNEIETLKQYIQDLQHQLEQSKNFIKMIKKESYQSSVTGICDVALKKLGDLDG